MTAAAETLALPGIPWRAGHLNREAMKMRGPLIMVTSAQPSLETHELDGAIHPNLGRLIQPRHTSSIERTHETGMPWAADNDCFQGLNEKKYVAMLDRITPVAESCLFVTVPDVVGDALTTAKMFETWAEALKRRGLPAALVAQDGLEDMAGWLGRTWHRIDALFIGGSTEWKESATAIAFADEARARGKWVHWGRVNTKRRFDLVVADHGDSFDGSKFARFRKTYLDVGLEWARVASENRIRVEVDAMVAHAEQEHA
jgi:hypothetical protein